MMESADSVLSTRSLFRRLFDVCRSANAWAAVAGLVFIATGLSVVVNFVPAVIVLPIAVLLTTWYVTLTFTRFMLRQEITRMQKEHRSQLSSWRLASGSSAALYDPSTLLLYRWYFEERLSEEVERSRRYGFPVTILAFRLAGPAGGRGSPTWSRMVASLGTVSLRLIRRIDLAASLGDSTYALCLPHTDRNRADVVLDRMASEFANYDFAGGIAICPEDSMESDELLGLALSRMNEAARETSAA